MIYRILIGAGLFLLGYYAGREVQRKESPTPGTDQPTAAPTASATRSATSRRGASASRNEQSV